MIYTSAFKNVSSSQKQFRFNSVARLPCIVKIIVELPRPSGIKDLRHFLGMVTYYFTYIPNVQQIAQTLSQEKFKKYFSNTEQHWLSSDKLPAEMYLGRQLQIKLDTVIPTPNTHTRQR